MAEYNADEIFQFAVRIEENGEKFYRDMSLIIKNDDIKKLFLYLADEEAKHRETFQNMVEQIEKYEPAVAFPMEYFSYLRSYADKTIFNEEIMEKAIKKISSPREAVEFAVEREWASILYYQEIKNAVPEDQQNLIDKIISEERDHFLKLSKIKEML